jgi:putative tryptophan/tyrosine transport system substrate-binding protein
MVTRRKLLAILATSALASPLRAYPQPERIRRIGFLAGRSRSTPSNPDPYYDAFVDELRKLGYTEGKTIAIEWRFAEGKYDRLPQLASDLVRRNVEVIVTHSTPVTRAAQSATNTIPIVFAGVGDPVSTGFAESLARPGRNITGLSQMISDLVSKQFELLKALLPAAARIGALMNPNNPNRDRYLKNLQDNAKRFDMAIVPGDAQSPEDIRRAFATMAQKGAQAVFIAADGLFVGQAHLLAELGLAHRLPSIGTYREHVSAGVLISYGDNVVAGYRRAAVYVDKILKGARPGELPIEQPTKIHLAINRKTAKALGVTIPRELLLRADEVFD